ncbi:MAG: type II secretion system protein [Candidatus Saccharimonadales bacterium]
MNAVYRTQRGFTIIEVVLVLAIAGFIFLMVLVALPSLQRGQRDAQRKQDVTRISTQFTNYVSSTRGVVPNSPASLGKFVKGYLNGPSATTAGEEYRDPNGEPYGIKYNITPDDIGNIGYYDKSSCVSDGSGEVTRTNTARDFALVIKLENQSAPYCIDNKA